MKLHSNCSQAIGGKKSKDSAQVAFLGRKKAKNEGWAYGPKQKIKENLVLTED